MPYSVDGIGSNLTSSLTGTQQLTNNFVQSLGFSRSAATQAGPSRLGANAAHVAPTGTGLTPLGGDIRDVAETSFGNVFADAVYNMQQRESTAKKLGVQVLSPGYTNPYGLLPGQREYKLVADKEFVQAAHQDGFRVVPWTINNKDILAQQIEAGVDGIITDYPTMLRKVMEDKGMPLPKSFTVKKELKEATKKD